MSTAAQDALDKLVKNTNNSDIMNLYNNIKSAASEYDDASNSAAELFNEKEAIKKALEATKQTLEATKKTLEDTEQKLKTTEQQRANALKQVAELFKEKEAAEQALTATKQTLEDTKHLLEAAKNTLDSREQTLKATKKMLVDVEQQRANALKQVADQTENNRLMSKIADGVKSIVTGGTIDDNDIGTIVRAILCAVAEKAAGVSPAPEGKMPVATPDAPESHTRSTTDVEKPAAAPEKPAAAPEKPADIPITCKLRDMDHEGTKIALNDDEIKKLFEQFGKFSGTPKQFGAIHRFADSRNIVVDGKHYCVKLSI